MEFLQGQLESTFINTYYLRNVKIWVFTFQPKLEYLIKRGTTWNNLELARNDLKWPTATYNEQETTCNDLKRSIANKKRPGNNLQRARNDLKLPTTIKTQPTTNLPTTSKKRRETTNNKQILRLFYNMVQSVLFSNTFSTQRFVAIIRALLHVQSWWK